MKTFTILCIAVGLTVGAPNQDKKIEILWNNMRHSVGLAIGAPYTDIATEDPWNNYRYAVDLDVAGKYWMFWTPDDETETITFEVHVEALGYVGFGLSPNGGMTGADVVIGWVLEDGTAVFHDRHAIGTSEPIIDNSQDVTLLAAAQNDTHTILRFSRPYVTCDEDDREITADTTRVIYSFSDADPENEFNVQYHGTTNRGTKSLVLLSYNDQGQTLPEDSVSMEFLVTETEIPADTRTTYWCEIMKIEPKDQKHHVVMYEPVVTPGNEGFVHHIVVYACLGEMQEEDHGTAWDCTDMVMPEYASCQTAMFLWAVGGNEFYFPEHAGIPFFEETSPTFMRIEMHYDNPAFIPGMIDRSGIRIHMTPTLREHDVGILIHGSSAGPYQLVPPHFTDLNYRSYCTPECLQFAINGTETMNVFAGYQHAHLLGSKMRTRLYRGDVELEPLMIDDNYDFNFQETRMMKEERIIYPDDTLVVDCLYDSSHKTDITVGGLATSDEMCVAFLFYYPKKDLYGCMSNPPEYQSIQMVDGLKFEEISEYPDFRITAPPEYANMTTLEVFKSLDWTNETVRNKYQQLLLEENAPMTRHCLVSDDDNIVLPERAFTPELGESWVEPDDGQCSTGSSFRPISSSFCIIIAALLAWCSRSMK